MRQRPACWRDRDGAVGMEMALVGVFLVPLVIGAVDIGLMVRTEEQLNQTLRSGFFYAWANNGSVTAANVQTIAAASYGASPQPTVNATITQYCITPATGYPSSGTPQTPTSGTCPSGTSIETYLSITATISFKPIIGVSYIPNGGSLSVTGQTRIQ
jgi:Flp pilus assembly protein TadG